MLNDKLSCRRCECHVFDLTLKQKVPTANPAADIDAE